jgi:hypothetical protein
MNTAFTQQIVNLVMVGDKDITENVTEAHSFIVVKKYPDYFQRLDYKIGAPLERSKSYSDSTLTVLQGNYYEYDIDGRITQSGSYKDNLKVDDWYYYNDTGKVILEEKYVVRHFMKTLTPRLNPTSPVVLKNSLYDCSQLVFHFFQ